MKSVSCSLSEAFCHSGRLLYKERYDKTENAVIKSICVDCFFVLGALHECKCFFGILSIHGGHRLLHVCKYFSGMLNVLYVLGEH